MKLLSWMHRKLQRDATGALQASVAGSSGTCVMLNSSVNNQGDYITSNDIRKTWEPNQQCQHHLKEFNGLNTKGYNENQPTEIFPGFLSIGTLSVEPISEPPTPTLDLPYQIINESLMAEMNLKLINEELEKFFKVEAEIEVNIDSSRKNSQASSITLSDEVKEDVSDHNSVIKQLNPLQGYLLGSSTELLEVKPKAKKEKASPYKLLKKSTTMDRSSNKEAESTQKKAMKKLKSSNLINKMLSPDISNHSTNHPDESCPAPRKLNKKKKERERKNVRRAKKTFHKGIHCQEKSYSKVKQFLRKKVHPEISKAAFAAKEPKYSKYEEEEKKKTKKKKLNSGTSYMDSTISSEKRWISCWGSHKKGKNHCANADIKLPQDAITKNNLDLLLKETNGGVGKENWIKTDDEYFILELQQNEEVQH